MALQLGAVLKYGDLENVSLCLVELNVQQELVRT